MICSNQRCSRGTALSKELCPKCAKDAGNPNKQVVFCKFCNVIYSIRPKVSHEEESIVEGICRTCKEELKKREKE